MFRSLRLLFLVVDRKGLSGAARVVMLELWGCSQNLVIIVLRQSNVVGPFRTRFRYVRTQDIESVDPEYESPTFQKPDDIELTATHLTTVTVCCLGAHVFQNVKTLRQ